MTAIPIAAARFDAPTTQPRSTTPSPIILVDGVCNLCNSAASWIIDRDPKAVFRFASLQSDIGSALLAGSRIPDPIPDSIVLIDENGAHTRSDAATRIFQRLGLPWTIVALARFLPRGLRDTAYDWVARNRYRWFGRQSACLVPTPSLRSRFLDADESSPISTPSPLAQELETNVARHSIANRGLLASTGAALQRLVLAYLLIYNLCFPLGKIPGTEGLFAQYELAKQSVVTWVAKTFFSLTITVLPNGSGDTTYNYVEVFTFAVLALLAASAWTALRRGSPVSPRIRDLTNTYIRYCLAAAMFVYGWAKVFPVQMPAPQPDRLMNTFADTSPMGLLWTFMGTSSAYQILAGLGEVIGGTLLLWRRTTLLGALVCAGVLANVVALNFCFDVPVKLYSTHLLIMALFLITPHAARLASLFVLNLPAQPVALSPFRPQSRPLRVLGSFAKAAFIYLIAVSPALGTYQRITGNELFGPAKPWQGIYRVESFTRDGISDQALCDTDRWVRVGLSSYGVGRIQRADGTCTRQQMAVNIATRSITVGQRGQPDSMPLKFSMPEPGLITISGLFDGAAIEARLRRADDKPPLLTSRGFRWINEFPLNR